MSTCIVDNQGRIVIPSTWRRRKGVAAGTELLVLEEDGCLILQTRSQAIREAQEIVRRSVRAGQSLVKELSRERRANAASEVKPGSVKQIRRRTGAYR